MAHLILPTFLVGD